MTQTATSYFNGLKSYLCKKYKVTQPTDGEIVLKEKIYKPNEIDLSNHEITIKFKGDAFAIKLDKYQSQKLFHFLEEESQPWAKRCDFVIFQCYRNKISVFCIEFKSGSFPEKLVDQLKASAAWCHALHATIKSYTNSRKKITIGKYVFSCHQNPDVYLDAEGKYLLRDHSIRHYLYDEVDGMSLEGLEHSNLEEAK